MSEHLEKHYIEMQIDAHGIGIGVFGRVPLSQAFSSVFTVLYQNTSMSR